MIISDIGTPAVAPIPGLFTLPVVDQGKHGVDDGARRRESESGLGGRTVCSVLYAVDVHERRYQPGERVDQPGGE
jgi:hypothetical protein